MKCKFCKNIFSNSSNLNVHQKKAKYCLKLQGIDTIIMYNCIVCCKNFSNKQRYIKHIEICYEEKIIDQEKKITILEYKNNLLRKQLQYNKNEHKYICNKLLEDNNKVSLTLASRSINNTNNTNNTQINQVINNLLPLTDEYMKEQAQYLTIDHIKDGVNGYARYAVNYPFKDRIACVDFSRRKIKYKNEDGNMTIDPEMTKLAHKLFQSIENRNTKLTKKYMDEMKDKIFNNVNDNNEMTEEENIQYNLESDALIDYITKISGNKNSIIECAKGMKSDFFHQFVRDVCSIVSV